MNEAKSILIVEDEVLIAKDIERSLNENGYIKVSIAVSFEEAAACIAKVEISLALLDVRIKGTKSGIDVARELCVKQNIPFIFLTSFNDQATLKELIKLKPVGYLNKPVNKFTLVTNINIFFLEKRNKSQVLPLKVGAKIYQISLSELLYVETEHVYINLTFKDKRQLLRLSLTNFLDMLPENVLIRINRSVAINPAFIEELSRNSVSIYGEEFGISKNYKSKLQDVLHNK